MMQALIRRGGCIGAEPHPSGRPAEPVQAWWQRVPPRILAVFPVAGAVCVFFVLYLPDYLGMRYPGWAPSMWMVDVVVAVVCGLLFANLMRGAQSRHRRMLQRFRMIADMNHHIRNALDQIQMSAYTSRDQQLVQNLHEGTARIEWALREVLPQADDDENAGWNANATSTPHF